MLNHPNAIIDLLIMRHEELAAESDQYRCSAHAGAIPHGPSRLLGWVRASATSRRIALGTRLRDLVDLAMLRTASTHGPYDIT